jgi:hypothetical protein
MKVTARQIAGITSTLVAILGAGLTAAPALGAVRDANHDLRHASHAPHTGASSARAPGRGHHARNSARHPGRRTSRGRGSAERRVEGSLDYELAPAGSSLPATQTITLFLPGGVRVAGATMPQCNPAVLERDGPRGCPKGSLVGSGSATGWTLGQLWPITLQLYNGPGGNLLSYITASSPVKIETVVEGTVTRPSGGAYGEEIANTIPQGLLEPLPGDQAQTVNLHVHVTGSSGWLRSTNCAPHALSVDFRFAYTNGQTISVGGNLSCV